MKISLRILIINFVIVAIVFLSSTFVYYSLTTKMIIMQHSRSLLNAANDFTLNYQNEVSDIQESFIKNKSALHNSSPVFKELDFVFKVTDDSKIDPEFVYTDSTISLDAEYHSISEFKKLNPNVILLRYQDKNDIYYYGKRLSSELIDNLARKIRSDIAIMINGTPVEISNYRENEKYIFNIIEAYKKLLPKNDFDISIEELEGSDFYATFLSSRKLNISDSTIKFLLFSKLPEAAELRSNINNLLWIIGLAGVAISMILVMLFTENIRRQITRLSEVAEQTRSGNLSNRVNIVTKDEFGKLAAAFDNMLDELERNEISKNEYTEFITLINQNPTLSEISEASLNKIINSINFTVGRISLVEDNEIKLLASYGLGETELPDKKIDLYRKVIENREVLEFEFSENAPQITTGLININLKYLLIYPVVYNYRTIAILELGAIYKPKTGIKDYLNNIHDQLAIGLTNANTYRKLKDSVNELKYLNEEYQKQNEQISQQNKKLLELHKELKENADELQIQKTRAEEGATLKSQFLASMSHELKTPLNSIIGLTGLMITDTGSESFKDKLKVVLRNGNRLMNLINDILSFSKMEAGKMELEKENFHIRDLLTEIESEIQPLAIEKKLNFIIHNEISYNAIFNSDKKKILQVLINLLSNSVKFTEKGMIIFKSRISENALHFDIIDSGIGISDDDLKIIFDEFRQLDGALNRSYNGTGLGLAISKRFALMLNGELTCQSEPGKGSTFIFTVPVEIIKGNQDNQLGLELFSRRNIILIDDADLNKDIISQYLSSKNFNVINSTREHCLRDVSENKPFAIACNFSTEKKGIWDLIIELTGNDNTKEVPFILYTIMDEMNVGYGLPVFSCISKNDNYFLQDIISKYQKLTGGKIEKIVHLNEKNSILSENGFFSVDIHELKITAKLFSKSDIILVDLLYSDTNAVEIIYQLKESVITRELPIILRIPESISEEEIISLNESFERCAVKSKGYPIDVLKIFRDRLHLEDGMPYEDTSLIWLESNSESGFSEEKSMDITSRTKPQSKHVVLIVDDDSDTLFTVGELVRRSGCETIYAKNGIECLSILRTMTPDLILLDVMMPKMDGFETIKRIKSDEHLAAIPVYAMTAQAMIEEKEIIIKNGFNDFIPKPVNAASLSFKVKKALINKTLEIPDEENISN